MHTEVGIINEILPLRGPTDAKYLLYRRRWYILIAFCVLSITQSLYWILFSPIFQETDSYFHTTNNWVNFLLAAGCIAYIPVVFFNTWLLDQNNGLKKSVLFAAICTFLSGAIRPVTTWFHARPLAIRLIALSQFFNAVAGPPTNASPSYLSAIWFGDGERAIATSLGATSTVLGSALGFLVSPYGVKWAGMGSLMWAMAGLGAFATIPIFCYFPARPPTPASRSSQLAEKARTGGLREMLRNMVMLFSNWRVAILLLSAGAQTGIYAAWNGLFSQILEPTGWSSTSAGWAGFLVVVSATISGVVGGIVADRFLRRQLKRIILWGMFGSSCCFMLFSLALPIPLVGRAVWKFGKMNHEPFMMLLVSIGGGCIGVTYPLFFELLAEVAYPVPEGTSAGVLTLLTNIFCVALLGLTPLIPVYWMNWITLAAVMLCGIATGLVDEKYIRSSHDLNVNYEVAH